MLLQGLTWPPDVSEQAVALLPSARRATAPAASSTASCGRARFWQRSRSHASPAASNGSPSSAPTLGTAVALPPAIPQSLDGEEGYAGGMQRLLESRQYTSALDTCIPPPNKCVYDIQQRDSPPPYTWCEVHRDSGAAAAIHASSSAPSSGGAAGQDEWSNGVGGGVRVVRDKHGQPVVSRCYTVVIPASAASLAREHHHHHHSHHHSPPHRPHHELRHPDHRPRPSSSCVSSPVLQERSHSLPAYDSHTSNSNTGLARPHNGLGAFSAPPCPPFPYPTGWSENSPPPSDHPPAIPPLPNTSNCVRVDCGSDGERTGRSAGGRTEGVVVVVGLEDSDDEAPPSYEAALADRRAGERGRGGGGGGGGETESTTVYSLSDSSSHHPHTSCISVPTVVVTPTPAASSRPPAGHTHHPH